MSDSVLLGLGIVVPCGLVGKDVLVWRGGGWPDGGWGGWGVVLSWGYAVLFNRTTHLYTSLTLFNRTITCSLSFSKVRVKSSFSGVDYS